MTNDANYCFSEVRRRIFAAGDCFVATLLAMTGPGIVIASEAKQSAPTRIRDRSYDIES
jgi:hypothetical protein